MSVSVLEYNSALQQYTLLQGWQSISINTGDSFVADIPAYALEDYNDLDGNGSATAYKLTGPKGRAIEPTLRLTGNNVEYHQVTLTSNNQKGVVTGGGQFVTSSFAQVQAIPMPTVEFLGWYLNGTCVSTDATYRFAVNDDVNLVAHFSEGNFNKLSVKATAGGRVNIDEMHLPESVEVQLIAEPEPGFEFDRWEVTAGSVQNAQSITTIFTMPASDASITAVFKNSNALTITQQPTDQFVVVGQTATFSIGATGDNLTYQWYIDRNNGRGWRKLDNAIGSEYTTSVVDLECDGFKYYCKVTDQYGNTINSNEAVLHVTTAPILPETGDSSTPMLWLALSMLSMLGILLMRKKAYSK
jgi:LPXTG-motif cell wall-anchored protein